MRRNILIVVSLVVLLIIGSAAVFAQEALNDDQQEWFDSRSERVEELVKDGLITREQADEYLERLEQCITDDTCRGYGTGCIEGSNCSFGLSRGGGCYGIEAGNGSTLCNQYNGEGIQRSCRVGSDESGTRRGCGR